MNAQQIAAIARQVLGILGIVFGVLTASVTSLHLPVALSTVLTVGGTLILAIEHYLSDPSTGTTNAPPPVVVQTATPPAVAAAPPVAA